jgi:hypothetical protein
MRKRNILIYTSGKYTATNPDGSFDIDQIEKNIQLAREHTIKLWEKGYTVLCPHLNTAHFEKDANLRWEDYINGDLELLSRCDICYMLPGWRDSKGALVEYSHAKKREIPIVTSLDEL